MIGYTQGRERPIIPRKVWGWLVGTGHPHTIQKIKYCIFLIFQKFPVDSKFTQHYNSFNGEQKFLRFARKDETAAMTVLEELVNILLEFTPEQLDRFLNDPITVSILQAEGASSPCPQEASWYNL